MALGPCLVCGQVTTGATCRHAASADAPDELVAVSEMLPAPEDCWLELEGERYTSELRIAAVGLTRRGHAKIELG
jgi:hypothetical protein